MYNNNTALASLLSARICHDLANPLGAISNGMELMELAGATRTPEFDLTADSIQNANAKLNFFRIAFGASDGSDVSAAQITKVLADVDPSARRQVEWAISTPTTRADAKVLFLLILCLESAMPRGGKITISSGNNGTTLSAQGAKLNCQNANWDHLSGHRENANLTPSEVHFELARLALNDTSKTMQLSHSDDHIVIQI